MVWTIKNRTLPIDYIVLHWTGSSSFTVPYRQVWSTLASRNLSIDAIVQDDGKTWRRADLNTTYSLHVGALNRRSLGIEVICPGNQYLDKYPARPRHNGYYLFSDIAIDEIAILCHEWCDLYSIPHNVLLAPNKLTPFAIKKAGYRGIIGHYHVSTTGKKDPGLRNLERLVDFGFQPVVIS